jgi:hypothetical protein
MGEQRVLDTAGTRFGQTLMSITEVFVFALLRLPNDAQILFLMPHNFRFCQFEMGGMGWFAQ